MTIKSVSDITLDHVWQALVWAEASQENPRGIHSEALPAIRRILEKHKRKEGK